MFPPQTRNVSQFLGFFNPFASPDLTTERLRGLLDAEIERTRRDEQLGLLESLPDDDNDSTSDYSHDDSSESEDSGDVSDADADDEDSDGIPESDDGNETEPGPMTIALPRLLHTRPICYIGTSASTSSSSSPPTWADLALPYNTLADAEEQERVRKAKRDAHRSRMKALAILGPEAASAI